MSKAKERISDYYSDLVANTAARPTLFNDKYSLDLADNPHDYMQSVERWNADRIMILMMVLHHHLKDYDPDTYALLLVGSDARRENAPHSVFEFCITTDNKDIAENIRNTILKHSCTNNHAFSEYPSHRIPTTDTIIEIKDISQASTPQYAIAGFNCNPEYIWPDRVLHAQLVWGSTDLFNKTQQRVLKELTTTPKLKTRLLRQGKNFLETSITGTTKRKGTLQKHFSLEGEKIFFQPDQYILGLKYSIIRLVQHILLTTQIHTQEIIEDGNTLNSLSELFSNLSTLYDDVTHSYSRALQLYHYQQQLFYETNSPAEATITIPQQELVEIIQPVIALYNHAIKGKNL